MNKTILNLMSYPGKHWYHTIQHVNNLYHILEKYQDKIIEEFSDLDIEKLKTVFDYHDVIYEIGSKDNELKSAEFYKNNAETFDKDVYDCILSTTESNTIFNNPLKKVMHDLDWFSLSDSYKNFIYSNLLIINEFEEKGGFDRNFVIEKRNEWLKTLLNKKVFITNTFNECNNKMRANILKYLGE